MDYTKSDAYVTHPGTGKRMHQDTAPITTMVTADDMNMVIWALMAMVESAGLSPAGFDPDDSNSYTVVMRAIRAMRGHDVLMDYGAKGDGITDCSAALQAALSSGRACIADSGLFLLVSGVTADYSAGPFPDGGYQSSRVDFSGSMPHTLLKFGGGAATAIEMVGSQSTPTQGIHGFDRIGGFTLFPAARNQQGTGMSLRRKAYTRVHDLLIQDFAVGLSMDGCLTSSIENVYCTGCIDGLNLSDIANFSRPNELKFERMTVRDSQQHGVMGTIGSSTKFTGCTFEQNGRHGTAGDGGFVANINGDNGRATVTFDNCYFEGNGGGFDLSLTNTTAQTLSVVLINCVFNRVDAARYVTNNIRLRNTGGGRIRCVLIGGGFMSGPGYVPSSARPFIDWDDATEVTAHGTVFSEDISMPVPLSGGHTMAGRVSASGAAVNLPPGVTVSKIAAGTYRVVRPALFAPTADGYVVVVTSNVTTDGIVAERVVQAANSFDVVIRNVDTNTNVDGAFSFLVCRVMG